MSKDISYIECGTDELRDIAHAHPNNGFLLESRKAGRPLELLTIGRAKNKRFILALSEDNELVGAVTFLHLETHQVSKKLGKPAILLSQISLREEFQKQGIAYNLAKRLFEKAAEGENLISITDIEPEAMQWSAKTYPLLHKDYPQLEICYSEGGEAEIVTGETPYQLVFDEQQPHVVFF